MGFRKPTAQQTFTITRRFLVDNEDTGEREEAVVSHIFRMPTPSEREEHSRRTVSVKRRKLQTNVTDANRYLWKRCCVDVVGYDDLPTPKPTNWQNYFLEDESGIGDIHIDEMTNGLLSLIGGEEVEEEEKK